MERLFLSISDCCKLTGLGRTKLYELIASGEIPLRKIGKRSLVAAADLQRWADGLPTTRDIKAGNQRNPQREAA